jgi:hypothetical protein
MMQSIGWVCFARWFDRLTQKHRIFIDHFCSQSSCVIPETSRIATKFQKAEIQPVNQQTIVREAQKQIDSFWGR